MTRISSVTQLSHVRERIYIHHFIKRLRKTYHDEANRIIALDKTLQERQQNLYCKQDRLNKQQSQLEQQCSYPEAKSYIARTAARILQKDLGNVTKAQKMEAYLHNLQNRLDDVLTMQAEINAELLLEQPLKLHKENTGGASARRHMENIAHSLIKPNHPASGGLSVSLHQQDSRDFTAMEETEREAQSENTI